jgi:hypothetical protein
MAYSNAAANDQEWRMYFVRMELKVSYGMNKSSPAHTSLKSAQLRAGRALIRWNAEDLARASAVGLTTIRRAELTDGETSMTAANDLAVRRALEAAGVEFINENGGGPGVRLRK